MKSRLMRIMRLMHRMVLKMLTILKFGVLWSLGFYPAEVLTTLGWLKTGGNPQFPWFELEYLKYNHRAVTLDWPSSKEVMF